jgi:RNA polymerase sigma-70 factor (ECF subfamily)
MSAELSDAEIIVRAQAGDDAAFELLIERHGRQLHGLAYYLCGDAHDADDIVQETFLGAYQALKGFESRASVKTWLSRILIRQAARHHRSKRVRKAAHPLHLSDASKALLEGSSAESGKSAEIRMDVMDVLMTLRPEYREVVVLRELDGLSYQEIEAVLGIPAGTVESRLFRARQEMKEKLKEYLG